MNYRMSEREQPQSESNDINRIENENGDIEIENGKDIEMATIEYVEDVTDKIPITPHYRRLTFISNNSCDFCKNVTKPGPYMHYLSIETKNGWVSCGDDACREKGKQAIEDFMKYKAYGRANHLKDRPIKVKRTSGQMDSDWFLERLYPEMEIDQNGVEKVCVTKPNACIEKWVSIDNLLSWNANE